LTPAPVQVAPGGSFQLSLYLISTSEVTTGIASIQFETNQSPEKFTLQSNRDLTGSSFPNALPTSYPSQLLPSASQLSQATADDVNSVPIELPAGNYLVGKYTFLTDLTTPKTTYVLSTFDTTGEGAYGGGPMYSPIALAPAAITVVVPEPSTIALAGLAAAGLLARRRRR